MRPFLTFVYVAVRPTTIDENDTIVSIITRLKKSTWMKEPTEKMNSDFFFFISHVFGSQSMIQKIIFALRKPKWKEAEKQEFEKDMENWLKRILWQFVSYPLIVFIYEKRENNGWVENTLSAEGACNLFYNLIRFIFYSFASVFVSSFLFLCSFMPT